MAIPWLAPHLVQTGMYSAAAEILHALLGGLLAYTPQQDGAILLLRASNSLQYREGHEVFSVVTGGRPLSFSRLISGGSRSSPDFLGENEEGASIPC